MRADYEDKENEMTKTIRARITKGVIEPLEKMDLPEGKEVSVTIFEIPSNEDLEAFSRSAGGWKGTLNADELIRNIYADRLVSTRLEPKL
jgi:predicted DNA-binding antitoxin AbrB/MazE fold protein